MKVFNIEKLIMKAQGKSTIILFNKNFERETYIPKSNSQYLLVEGQSTFIYLYGDE